MPIVHVYGFSRSVAKRRQVIHGITDTIVNAYGVPKESVTVFLIDVGPEHSGAGRIMAADLPQHRKKTTRKGRRK